MPSTLRRALPLAAVAAFAAPAAAQAQSATTADVAGGQTMLQVGTGTARALNGAGVTVDLLRPARVTKSGLTFRATGGAIDPATLRGSVEHNGGIRFRAGGTSVSLRNFTYTIGQALDAVGAGRLVAADDPEREPRQGGGRRRRAADQDRERHPRDAHRGRGALNRAFRTRLHRAGLKLGTVRTSIDLADAVFKGGATTLALDPGAASALQQLGITPGVVGDATAGASGLAFPITGGKVNAETLAGQIAYSGGISLTKGSTRVEVTDFVIDTTATPKLTALLGGQRVDLLTLDVSGVQRSVEGDTIVVGNVVGKLTAGAAAALNQAFSTNAFTEGLTLGTATVRGEVRQRAHGARALRARARSRSARSRGRTPRGRPAGRPRGAGARPARRAAAGSPPAARRARRGRAS